MLSILLFITGLAIGSFLNVVIYRLPRRESIVYPPSHCPHCRHKLAAIDLIPVISYLMLKGKCRYCGKKIPMLDTITEIITGLLFLYTYLVFADTGLLILIYSLLMVCIFTIIFFTDL